MIDVHGHLFNARSLPLYGIFRSRGVPAPIAVVLDAAIRTRAADDHSLDVSAHPLPAHVHGMAVALADGSLPDSSATPMSHQSSVEWLIDRMPSSLLLNKDLKLKGGAKAGLNDQSFLVDQRRAELKALVSKGGFGPGSIGQAISFVVRLLKSERGLLQELQRMSTGVELHVHHMMDMEYSYGDRPDYEFVRQLHRMRNLAVQAAGRIIGFVAFEPLRTGALRHIEAAVAGGFCGVKFYPPSGYRPIGNVKSPITPIDPSEIDVRNLALFTFCAERDIPVFAHCTPHGFERLPAKSGKNSDPIYWAQLLEHRRFTNLRLCLGHAGGHDGWFDLIPAAGEPDRFAKTYAGRVVELCSTYPNVYCEFGHMEPVMTVDGRKRLAYWLNAAITHNPVFASKIMFGSDYPMLLDEGPWPQYLPSMQALFTENPSIQKHREAFFRDNALAYLNLPRFLRESAGALSDAEANYLRDLMLRRAEAVAITPGPTGAHSEALTVAVLASAAPNTSEGLGEHETFPVDCLVLGAGISGVTAARELKRNYFGDPRDTHARRELSVLVLEGSDRVGGRMHSLYGHFQIPVELGAELIHRARPTFGGPPPMRNFWTDVDRYGLVPISIDKLDNNAISTVIYFSKWSDGLSPLIRTGCHACNDKRFNAGIDALNVANVYGALKDATVSSFIEDYICGKRGYCDSNDIARAAADYLLTGTVPGNSDAMSAASVRFDRVKEQEHSEEEYHIAGGYDQLPRKMVDVEGLRVVFGAKVKTVHWNTRGNGVGVTVVTHDGRRFFGKSAISSFSIGMLQSKDVTFNPPLPPSKLNAIAAVGMGPESKVVLKFKQRFWPLTMAILSNPGTRKGGRSYFVPSYGQADAALITAFLTRTDADPFDEVMPEEGRFGHHGPVEADVDAIHEFIEERVLTDLVQIFKAELGGHGIATAHDLAGFVEAFYCRSWAKDPFAKGATSFIRFGGMDTAAVGKIRATLADPLTTLPLYWAGEATATDTQPWSVHGAHSTGVRAAWQVRRTFVLQNLW